MDKTVIAQHYKVIAEHYPDMSMVQLGLVCLMIGSLRASMGHEGSRGTIDTYIHTNELSAEVRQCVDFLEREVLSIKKSKIDIDYWKRGNKGSYRRDKDLVSV